MGGNRFQNRRKGHSMQDAYRAAVSAAEFEYGHQQGYSGEINCTGGFLDVTSKWKASKLSPNQFIDHMDDHNGLTKGNAYGICVHEPKTNKNKIKTQVNHRVEPGTKKWKLVYVVSNSERSLGSKDTKGEAVKMARAYTEAHQRKTYINMEKVLEKGSTQVAEIVYKPSKEETPGEYIFFGIAPC